MPKIVSILCCTIFLKVWKEVSNEYKTVLNKILYLSLDVTVRHYAASNLSKLGHRWIKIISAIYSVSDAKHEIFHLPDFDQPGPSAGQVLVDDTNHEWKWSPT